MKMLKILLFFATATSNNKKISSYGLLRFTSIFTLLGTIMAIKFLYKKKYNDKDNNIPKSDLFSQNSQTQERNNKNFNIYVISITALTIVMSIGVYSYHTYRIRFTELIYIIIISVTILYRLFKDPSQYIQILLLLLYAIILYIFITEYIPYKLRKIIEDKPEGFPSRQYEVRYGYFMEHPRFGDDKYSYLDFLKEYHMDFLQKYPQVELYEISMRKKFSAPMEDILDIVSKIPQEFEKALQKEWENIEIKKNSQYRGKVLWEMVWSKKLIQFVMIKCLGIIIAILTINYDYFRRYKLKSIINTSLTKTWQWIIPIMYIIYISHCQMIFWVITSPIEMAIVDIPITIILNTFLCWYFLKRVKECVNDNIEENPLNYLTNMYHRDKKVIYCITICLCVVLTYVIYMTHVSLILFFFGTGCIFMLICWKINKKYRNETIDLQH